MEFINNAGRFLGKKLEEIQQKNKKYSLRSFAQRIQMSPSGLSQIMSGHRNLSIDRAYRVADSLNLNTKEKSLFLKLVEYDRAIDPELKEEIFQKIKRLDATYQTKYFDLTSDQFHFISNWYGLALYECICGYGSGLSDSELARHFAIKENQVTVMLDRLVRLDLIKKNDEGSWESLHGNIKIESENHEVSIKKYYTSLHELSVNSYQNQSPQKRVSAAEVFTVSQDQIEKIKKITNEYIDQVCSIAEQKGNQNQTYQLLINIFNLSNTKGEN